MSGKPDRPIKRLRRLSTDYDDSEGTDDWIPQKKKASSTSNTTSAATRPRRGAAANSSSATIERASPEDNRLSIHLTVKAPPNKLREATSGTTSRRNVATNSRDTFVGGEIISGPRGSRSKKPIVEESSEELDSDEDMEDQDAPGEDDDEDVDAEGEEDIDMDDGYSQPIKPSISVTAPDITSVEATEMMMDDEEEEEALSELESQEALSDAESQEDPSDVESIGVGNDDDLEGDDDDDDDDLDSDDETPASMSRGGTPDLSKLTRRQRAAFEDNDGSLISLSNEAQKKKHLTAEEHAMRRAEMARRRKNLSEKRNEEEKMDTINRLLKKQPPKRRGRGAAEAVAESAQEEEPEFEKPSSIYVRYVQTGNGASLAIPEEWLNAPIGEIFNHTAPKATSMTSGKMVEEVA